MNITWLLAASFLFLAGCNDAVTGGHTANGDRSNFPVRGIPDGGQLSPHPTENNTGPWYGQKGLNDATTWGTKNDRPHEQQPSTEQQLPGGKF